ncbi:Cell division cycle 37 protein, CDC37 [Phaffia rhodozyma]|uniref:Hsp90 chaperone protein kinase-targeting subunit n=1 Tax=Phaffia rhodozyma TaxID=264483 RepID=A0A0F7SUU7_PHARH|nr:Cell division cycle 37 protein, CDC37 [Phaffia rhodozyma]
MPLNYSKWDMLELSDDSDIEEHPNIDKKSMIRWKQQSIHQKRQERQQRIAKLRAEISLNETLRPRIVSLLDSLKTLPPKEATSKFSSLVSQLTNEPSPDKPNTGAPNQPTYDVMLLHLLEQVAKEAKDGAKDGEDTDRLASRLTERLEFHNGKLDHRTEECGTLIEQEEKEEKSKITSEHIHEGFSSGFVNKAGENILEEKPKPASSKKKETTIEVLNPESSKSATVESDDDEDLPMATPIAKEFTNIRYGDFDGALRFIQSNPSIMAESNTDSLLLEAFNSEIDGKKVKAKVCVEKGLLIQYCRKLGRDGVRLFFQRMNQPGEAGKKALHLFQSDVEATYQRMATRVKEMAAEKASSSAGGEGEEQIQLVAEGGASVSFNIPEGPPPEEIRLEGEGTEGLDPVQVRAYLMQQWEIFDSFENKMKDALKKESLDEVNKVLGSMKLDEAEKVVGLMSEAGILNFQDGGAIRDETGK